MRRCGSSSAARAASRTRSTSTIAGSRAIVKACRDLPGYELFQYVDDDGARQVIDSADVNAYLREISGDDFTAKDFRTWAGTVLAAQALAGVAGFVEPARSEAQRRAGDRVGGASARQHQGGVPQVLHPSGGARRLHGRRDHPYRRKRVHFVPRPPALTAEERAVVALVSARLRRKTA